MNIGFIGCGNMGGAIIRGLLAAGTCKKEEIYASAKTMATCEKIVNELGIYTSIDSRDVANQADIIFICVKPIVFDEVLAGIANECRGKIVISVAAGKSIAKMEEILGKDAKVVRSMPNTPALVLEAMSAVCVNSNITAEDMEVVLPLFKSFGECEVVSESLMDVVVGISGSSPAYVYMFIEALAQGACAEGMNSAVAMKFAAQAVMGSAKMVLESGKHPAKLRDEVCSPAGTTIDGVLKLDELGFKNVVIEGERTVIEKSRRL